MEGGTNVGRIKRDEVKVKLKKVLERKYQETMNQVHDSTRENMDSTTQYINHGVSWAGSEVRRAL